MESVNLALEGFPNRMHPILCKEHITHLVNRRLAYVHFEDCRYNQINCTPTGASISTKMVMQRIEEQAFNSFKHKILTWKRYMDAIFAFILKASVAKFHDM